MGDACAGRVCDHGLGAKGDAEAGGLQHGEVVGAVADRHRLGERDGVLGCEGAQDPLFCVAVEHGFGDGAGEGGAVIFELVREMRGKAEMFGDAGGEIGEPAGDEGGDGAVGAHGGDEFARAGAGAEAGGDAIEGGEWRAAEPRDAVAECRAKINLAFHAACGDGGDFGADPGFGGEFVDHFGGDDGAVHVGGEQTLAPAREGEAKRVDRPGAEEGRDHRRRHWRGAGEIGGLAGREDFRRPRACGVGEFGDGGGIEGGCRAVGDEGEDVIHGGRTMRAE